MGFPPYSNKGPFRTSLDELIKQYTDIIQRETADVEAEELRRVARAELQSDVRRRAVFEAWVFDLASDLVCFFRASWSQYHMFEKERKGERGGVRKRKKAKRAFWKERLERGRRRGKKRGDE